MTKTSMVLLLAGLLWADMALAQNNISAQKIEATVEQTYAEYLGHIPAVRTLIPVPATDPERRKMGKKPRSVPKNFQGRGKQTVLFPERQFIGPDPVRQTSITGGGNVAEPLVNINGLFTGSSPHDPSGDVGNNYYLQAVNATQLGVYDKDGNIINSFAANTIWSSIGFSSAGDPIVLYDQEAERWLITEFPNGNRLLVAISVTDDPLGEWDAFSFSTPSFPDYPKYGIWGNAYSVTTNEGGTGTLHAYFIDRQAILDVAAMVPIQRIGLPGTSNTESGFTVATPVDWTGPDQPSDEPLIVTLNDSSWSGNEADAIEVYSIKLNWEDPDLTEVTNTSVVTAPYDAYACASPGFGFACIPQLGGNGIDGIPEVIMNQTIYRNFGDYETMVMNFMTDVNGEELSGIRWTEIRRYPGEDWAVYQEGTWAPDDGLHRFMGGIAMDSEGNIGLAYNVSSEDTYVGVRFTGRRATDPLGEMTFEEYTVVDGQSTIASNTRFGDYAHMAIDPVNDRTFWYTTEYAGPNGTRTRIVAFDLRKDTTDLVPLALLSPLSAPELTASEMIQMEVINQGLDTLENFSVGYVFNGNPAVIDTLTLTLFPDSTYVHTFGTTEDLSVIGDYPFTLFVHTEGDDQPRNDTLDVVVSHLPRLDVGITGINTNLELICGAEFTVALVLTNLGTDTLTSALVNPVLNGVALDPIMWEGALASGEFTIINLTITDAVDGLNTLSVDATLPNGAPDQQPANDGFSRDFEVLLNGIQAMLNIQTDDYPAETTWELTNENGEILYEGGPYSDQATLVTQRLCLDPEACYVFTMFDSYGDGICCVYGEGNYEITDEEGLPLLTSTGEFAFQETNNFCATFTCTLAGDVEVAPTSAPGVEDGTILIIASSGVGPFEYSADGGQTYQEENFFTALPAGDYEVVILGAGECTYTETVTIASCTLEFSTATVMGESEVGASDGQIEVLVVNGVEPYTYQLGNNTQDQPLFDNLSAGDYTLTIQDALGCTVDVNITLDVIISTDNLTTISGTPILVYPNPTEGVFQIELPGLETNTIFLPVQVYDGKGSLLYQSQLTQYDGRYIGSLSLYAYPDGVYFVRFLDERVARLVRVVKQ